MKSAQTFSKPERLCSLKSIGQLFEKGEKWTCYPFRIVLNWTEKDDVTLADAAPVQILISASKRSFKHAVDRNLIKRRIREAYSIHKFGLLKQISDRLSKSPEKILHIGFLYTAKKIEPWILIEKKMIQALNEIIEKTNSKTT